MPAEAGTCNEVTLMSKVEDVVKDGIDELIKPPVKEEMAFDTLSDYLYYCMQNLGHMISCGVPNKLNPKGLRGKKWTLFSSAEGKKCFDWMWVGIEGNITLATKDPWDLIKTHCDEGLAGYYFEAIAEALPLSIQATPSHLSNYELEESWALASKQAIVDAAKRCSQELQELLDRG